MSDHQGREVAPVYTAAALQLIAHSVARFTAREEARARINLSLAHIDEKVRGARGWLGPALKLIVLPEYVLTSFPQGESIPSWADKAALAMDGPEYESLGRTAQANGVFIAGNAYETDPHFPGLYFQCCFIIAPSGDVILRYRRLNSMYAPTPHDVWDRYLDHYGLDGVFPVARTEIGRLAPIASEEIMYPEIARCFAMRGAEVFCHPTSENGSPLQTRKDAAKVCRAVENMAYVVSANTAGIHGTDLPNDVANGGSRVIDYRGKILRQAGWGESINATAEIDLSALRRERRKPGMTNYLSRQRFEVFAETYSATLGQPANSLLDQNGGIIVPERKHFETVQRDVIARLSEEGIL